MQDIVLVFEFDQIDEIVSFVQAAPQPPRLVACTFWIERELAKRGVAYESFSKWRLSDEERAFWMRKVEDIAHQWYRLPELAFFTHRGIQLAEAAEPAVDGYLQHLLYYFAPLKKMIQESGPGVRVVVPHVRGSIPVSGGMFTAFELYAITDIVRFLARDGACVLQELGTPPPGAVLPFPPQSKVVKLLRVWNLCMRLFVPRKPLKLFASENWYHIAPFMQKMDDVELVLMDRSEVRHIPKLQLLKHRIRLIHPIDIQTTALRNAARERQQAFKAQWATAREAVARMPEFQFEGESLWPLVAPAFDFFVGEYAQRLVYDIDALAAIFTKEKIQKVVLRASVSGHQPHFYLAAKVAMSLDIPSIELQHAGAVLDPDWVPSRLESSYLASYGSLMRDIYVRNHGYEPDRIRAIGSPRFDRYKEVPVLPREDRDAAVRALGLDPARPVVLVATPGDQPALIPHVFDTYDNAQLFATMAGMQRALPDTQVVFKFRGTQSCTPLHREYINEVFDGENYAIVGDDLFFRIQMSDMVCSNNSSAMYETMIARKPLVLFPWRSSDPHLPIYTNAAPAVFDPSAQAAIAKRILTEPAYAAELVARSSAFIRDGYSFDGHASERMTALLREDLLVYTSL